MYVISISDNATQKLKYLTYDRDWGYVFGSDTLAGAHIFPKLDDAAKACDKIMEEKPCIMADGTIYPPTSISEGLGINNANPKADGVLAIEVIYTETVTFNNIQGEIKKPIGYVY